MKNKQNKGFAFIALIIAAAVVLASVGGYYAVKASKGSRNKSENATSTEGMDINKKISIKDLMALGKDISCTFSKMGDKANASSTGTLYLSGNKFRVDTVVENRGQGKIESHMIRIDSKNYIWTSLSQGQGILIDASSTPRNGESVDSKVDINENAALDYKCSPWAVDQSKFTLPSDVKFMDLAQTLLEMGNNIQKTIKINSQKVPTK